MYDDEYDDEDYDADYDKYDDDEYEEEELEVIPPEPMIVYKTKTTVGTGTVVSGVGNIIPAEGLGLLLKPYNPLENNETIEAAINNKVEFNEMVSEGRYIPDRIYRYAASVNNADPKVGAEDNAPYQGDQKDQKETNKKPEVAKVVDDPTQANLVTSECTSGMHAPVIDFDLPIEVYPSSQLGHHHLYINKEISWDDHKKLLTVLSEVGLIEKGYANASIDKGYSAVRPLGVVKVNAPRGVEVLIENARMRKLINDVNQENIYLRQKLDEDVNEKLLAEQAKMIERIKELETALEEQNNLMATRVSWA
jgi:hypothetical protein